MISEEIIQKVKDQNDIVDVISESVKLKRAGRNFSGLCPFHHEKTASFSVSQDKQIYKCFGCGEAGNVITFVMKNKNLPFMEAVKNLAERVNIDIDFNEGKNTVVKDTNEKIYKMNVEAAKYFFNKLKTNKKALSYFLGRGISEKTIRTFGLGYSPDSWKELLQYLKYKGYSELDLLNAGLIIKSQNESYYDRFRNRIMFPVFDYRGKVIGFGGRVLDDSKPKYLNSPETSVFKKGTNLYGLNFALKNNVNRMFIIVEGYLDCISLHQYGITNVVASLGTALTSNQAKLLKRHADKVIISYDSDLAGQSATLRGLEVLKNEGFDVKVLTVPQGKDPDEYIRSNGKEAFLKLVDEALPLIDYRIKRIREGVNFKNSEDKINFVRNAALVLSDLDPVEKDVYIKKISEETDIKEQAIFDLISVDIQKNVKKSQDVNIVDNFGQKLYLEPTYIKAERNILKLMVKDKETLEYILKNIQEEDLLLESHKKIYKLIRDSVDYNKEEKERHINSKCDDIESSKEWVSILELDLIFSEEEAKRFINDCIKEIKKFKLEETKKEIMNKIKQYEAQGLIEDSLRLAQELVKIQKDLGNL